VRTRNILKSCDIFTSRVICARKRDKKPLFSAFLACSRGLGPDQTQRPRASLPGEHPHRSRDFYRTSPPSRMPDRIRRSLHVEPLRPVGASGPARCDAGFSSRRGCPPPHLPPRHRLQERGLTAQSGGVDDADAAILSLVPLTNSDFAESLPPSGRLVQLDGLTRIRTAVRLAGYLARLRTRKRHFKLRIAWQWEPSERLVSNPLPSDRGFDAKACRLGASFNRRRGGPAVRFFFNPSVGAASTGSSLGCDTGKPAFQAVPAADNDR
jgi:hypothetical protein